MPKPFHEEAEGLWARIIKEGSKDACIEKIRVTLEAIYDTGKSAGWSVTSDVFHYGPQSTVSWSAHSYTELEVPTFRPMGDYDDKP